MMNLGSFPTPPAPDPDVDDAFWWEALRNGQLLLPQCDDCSRTWMRPSPGCPFCGSLRSHTIKAAGNGRVYSWVVVHRALDPAFIADVPYTVLAVTLDEGARLFGQLLDGGPVANGMEVRAVIYQANGHPLVGFAPGKVGSHHDGAPEDRLWRQPTANRLNPTQETM